MDLNRQPSRGSRNIGGSGGHGGGKTSAAMGKIVTENPIQPSSLSADTKMKILAAEMELLNDFLFEKHGVRTLNVNSIYFKALHAQTPEMHQIKRSLDASLTEISHSGKRGGDDLDATLIVVKEEPNWDEEDTLVVEPGEAESDDSDEQGSGLNVEQPKEESLSEPRSTNGAGVRRHKCNQCHKAFASASHKKTHERTHTGEMPFKCQFCPKAFAAKSNKSAHERIHNNDKPFRCQFCSQMFARKQSKIDHERIHNNDKPFSCQFCPKTFSDKSNKSKHERIHRDDRSFSCELCDATFRQRSAKTAHMRTHTREKPFQCEDCEASFGRKGEKVRHMRIHTGEKAYRCEYCDKWFSSKSNLSVHLRIHTNEKPYTCSVCGKSFTRFSDLQRHEKTHRK